MASDVYLDGCILVLVAISSFSISQELVLKWMFPILSRFEIMHALVIQIVVTVEVDALGASLTF